MSHDFPGQSGAMNPIAAALLRIFAARHRLGPFASGFPSSGIGFDRDGDRSYSTYEVQDVKVTDSHAQPKTMLKLIGSDPLDRDQALLLATSERDARALLAWSAAFTKDRNYTTERAERQALFGYEAVMTALRVIEKKHSSFVSRSNPAHLLEWAHNEGRIGETAQEIRRSAREKCGVSLGAVGITLDLDLDLGGLGDFKAGLNDIEIHKTASLEIAKRHDGEWKRAHLFGPENARHDVICDWIQRTGRSAELRQVEERLKAEAKASSKKEGAPEPFHVSATAVSRPRTSEPVETKAEAKAPIARRPRAIVTKEALAARLGDPANGVKKDIADAAAYGDTMIRLYLLETSTWAPFFAALDNGVDVNQSDYETIRRAGIDFAHARLVSLYPGVYFGNSSEIREMAHDVLDALRDRD